MDAPFQQRTVHDLQHDELPPPPKEGKMGTIPTRVGRLAEHRQTGAGKQEDGELTDLGKRHQGFH